MVPFLKQTARHYLASGREISKLCFVFPSRRALRFFEHYLGEEIAASGTGPVVSPRLFTMNDFFYHTVGARPSDRTRLLLELYEVYKSLNPAAEPLDDFIFWGDTLLGDFDDIDKYLVNPDHIFANKQGPGSPIPSAKPFSALPATFLPLARSRKDSSASGAYSCPFIRSFAAS